MDDRIKSWFESTGSRLAPVMGHDMGKYFAGPAYQWNYGNLSCQVNRFAGKYIHPEVTEIWVACCDARPDQQLFAACVYQGRVYTASGLAAYLAGDRSWGFPVSLANQNWARIWRPL